MKIKKDQTIQLDKSDLHNLFSLAATNYNIKGMHGLDQTEFKAVCWIEAVKTLLGLDIKIEYPYDVIIEPDEE